MVLTITKISNRLTLRMLLVPILLAAFLAAYPALPLRDDSLGETPPACQQERAGKPSKPEIDYSRFRRENISRDMEQLMNDAWRNIANERYDSATAYYSLVASRYSDNLSLRDKRRCAIACVNIGYLWLAWRLNAAEAYPWLTRAREIATRYNFDFIETSVISNIGQIYFDYNNLPKAVELFKTTLNRVIKETGGSHYFGRALIDFSTAAMMTRRNDLIKDMSEKILSVNIPDEEPLKEYVAVLRKSLWEYCSGNLNEAAVSMEKSIPLFDLSTDRVRYLTKHHIITGIMWMEAGDFDKGKQHFKEVIRIASEGGLFNFMEKGYDYLVECEREMGNNRAMEAYRFRGMQIRDSLFNATRFETVKDLEIADELNKLNEDVRESVREATMQRRIITLTSVAGIILLLALVLLYMSHRRLRSAYREICKSYVEHSSSGSILPDVAVAEPATEGAEDSDSKGLEILSKVRSVMENGGPIFRSDFSVDLLADMIGEKPKGVSLAINSLSGKNFNTMLTEYRIREACRLLSDAEKMKSMSMEGIAECVGYKSRTYFSRVFKEVTGLTPSQFARQARESAAN